MFVGLAETLSEFFERASNAWAVILFKEAECTRRGSHLLCARSTPKKGRGWTGLVCWGDIYLKR